MSLRDWLTDYRCFITLVSIFTILTLSLVAGDVTYGDLLRYLF